jgi:hypothetical protein
LELCLHFLPGPAGGVETQEDRNDMMATARKFPRRFMAAMIVVRGFDRKCFFFKTKFLPHRLPAEPEEHCILKNFLRKSGLPAKPDK